MEPYVKSVLDRVGLLVREYETAVECNRVAWLEQRDAQANVARWQQERDMLISLLNWWADCTSTRFEDKQVLETAAVALRTAGRKAL